jgi:nitroreductase
VSLSPFRRLVLSRTSVRHYEERDIPDTNILAMMEAARLAPSAENAQPWRFVTVKSPAARQELSRACFSGIFSPTRFAARAPLIVALCAERRSLIEAGKSIKDRAMYQLDCGIAGEHLVLQAAELGLGTCWIGWFNRRAAARALGVPWHVQVVALISVGYPRAANPLSTSAHSAPRRRPRNPLSSMLWLDSWGKGFPGADAYGDEK